MAKKPTSKGTPQTGLQKSAKSVQAWQKAGKPGSLLGWQTKRLLQARQGQPSTPGIANALSKNAKANAGTGTTVKRRNAGGLGAQLVSGKRSKGSAPAPSGARQRLKRRARS